MSFNPNHSLLNPKFEGYKFNPLSEETATKRYDLPYLPTQTNPTSTHSMQPMSFQEVQSRIGHNHLSSGMEGGTSIFVDAEYQVVVIRLDPVSAPLHKRSLSFTISASRKPLPPPFLSCTSCQNRYRPQLMWIKMCCVQNTRLLHL